MADAADNVVIVAPVELGEAWIGKFELTVDKKDIIRLYVCMPATVKH